MPLDFTSLVLDPCYAAFGVAGTLTVGGQDYALTAIDHTAGVQLPEGGVLAQTETPGATVRASELAALGVDAYALADASLTFNGTTWRITSTRPLPSPNGEPDGEYLLLLEQMDGP